MFASKVWTGDRKLLLESNLTTTRQPLRVPHHVMQATTSEGLAKGRYVAANVGFEPATFQTQNLLIKSGVRELHLEELVVRGPKSLGTPDLDKRKMMKLKVDGYKFCFVHVEKSEKSLYHFSE